MLLAVFFAGLRHGFDLDHIAAITDISSSQIDRRRSMVLGTIYAVGHAVVLVILGAIAVVAGRQIPRSFDEVMGRVIGATLILLGIYVIYSLARFGRAAHLRSRWMVVLAGIKRTVAWIRRTPVREVEISHEHAHPVAGHHHDHDIVHPVVSAEKPGAVLTTTTHSHPHSHVVRAPTDPFAEYGPWTCLGIGMIHGVGAETPSQVALFTAAAGVTGALGGLPILLSFVAGLFLGNSLLVVSAAGLSSGRRLPSIYFVVAVASAIVSLVVGSIYLFG
ncbi:MAG: hypothetical protein QOG16_124 [Actinomycetota bacterium]|nr:hypothetical protein [Actinomycetota bacterium]